MLNYIYIYFILCKRFFVFKWLLAFMFYLVDEVNLSGLEIKICKKLDWLDEKMDDEKIMKNLEKYVSIWYGRCS